MKCLSLWQPWATLFAAGLKDETRHWYSRHRGPLLVHAAAVKDRASLALCLEDPDFAQALSDLGIKKIADLPFGAIIGVVNMTACHKITANGLEVNVEAILAKARAAQQRRRNPGNAELKSAGSSEVQAEEKTVPASKVHPLPTGARRSFGDYSPGRFAFMADQAITFPTPFPHVGRQQFFHVHDRAPIAAACAALGIRLPGSDPIADFAQVEISARPLSPPLEVSK